MGHHSLSCGAGIELTHHIKTGYSLLHRLNKLLRLPRKGLFGLSHWSYLFLAVSALTLSLPAQADIAGGINWLTSQSQVDGSIQNPNSLATTVQATNEAVRALTELDAALPVRTAAMPFLLNDQLDNAESLSRRVVLGTLTGQNTSIWINELMSREALRGGIGEFAGYDTTLLDTAYVLEALDPGWAGPFQYGAECRCIHLNNSKTRTVAGR